MARAKKQQGTKLTHLPGSVQATLVDCITETEFDQQRFNAVVGEHVIGLSEAARRQLIDQCYEKYVEQHDGQQGNL